MAKAKERVNKRSLLQLQERRKDFFAIEDTLCLHHHSNGSFVGWVSEA
jgi:hypothetical protein